MTVDFPRTAIRSTKLRAFAWDKALTRIRDTIVLAAGYPGAVGISAEHEHRRDLELGTTLAAIQAAIGAPHLTPDRTG